MTKPRLIFLALFLFCVSAVAAPIEAARLYVDIPADEINAGGQFNANIILDAGGQNINAVEGTLIFDPDILAAEQISDGGSAIDLWAKSPAIVDNRIIFSGAITGGFNGRRGKLFSAIFRAKRPGAAEIKFETAKCYKNDGRGTPVKTETAPVELAVGNGAPAMLSQSKNLDNEPPVIVEPQIARDETIFDGRWFLAFAARDAGSGIAGIQVQETRANAIDDRLWEPAQTPRVLNDQELKSYIFVKAVDNAGNEMVKTIPPRNAAPWYENRGLWVILLIAAAALFALLRFKKASAGIWKEKSK